MEKEEGKKIAKRIVGSTFGEWVLQSLTKEMFNQKSSKIFVSSDIVISSSRGFTAGRVTLVHVSQHD